MNDNMHFIHYAAQDIPRHSDSQIDLILFHAVLEWAADPQAVLRILWSMLRPGGVLPLVFHSTNGPLIRDVLTGNFGYVQQGIYKGKRRALSPDFPRDPQQVYDWLEKIGWEIAGETGMRVFHDHLHDEQRQHDCFDVLTETGTCCYRQEPYISLGHCIHVTAIEHPARAADARVTYE